MKSPKAVVAPIATARDLARPQRCPALGAVATGRAQRGFTMLELLIVFTIGSVLAVIAVPSFRDMLNTTRQNSAVGLVISDLNQARGEAIKRNVRVLMCVRNAAGTQCGAGTDWRGGWVICTEGAVADQCSSTTPMTVRPPLDTNLTLAGSAATIRFKPDSTQGVAGLPATLTVGGTWSGAADRTVTIAATGHISK